MPESDTPVARECGWGH